MAGCATIASVFLALCFPLEQIFETWKFRFHPLVPESEIQTIIILEFLVVQVMVSGTDEPSAQPVPLEVFRINLHAGVIDGTRYSHDKQKQEEHQKMHR